MAISPESKMRSPDRVLVLKAKEGMKPTTGVGVSDPRLFTGANKLHVIMDPLTCLWRFKYDMGVIPEPLKGTFTNFTAAKKFAVGYYDHRNIEIVEVKD